MHSTVAIISSFVLSAALFATSLAAQDSTWRDHDRAARDARLRGDWKTSSEHLERMDVLLGGHPAVVAALARAQAQLGDTAAAVATLDRLAAMGGFVDIAADSQLAIVQHDRRAIGLQRRLLENRSTVGAMIVAATLPQVDLVVESIAYDERRRQFFVSSMRHRKIVTVSATGTVSDFIDLARDDAWAALAVATDAKRNRLWVTTEWSPVTVGGSRADSGRAAVLQYELASGALVRRLELPRDGTAHEPGDIAVGSNGDLFVSDGQAGVIYVVRDGGRALDTLVRRGGLVSPQGIAPASDGRRLFVADYARGIAVVDRETGAVTWPSRPRDVMANGIDGLILHGGVLIGVQNGVTPERIVALEMDRGQTAILGAHVLVRDSARVRAPTHLVALGNDIYFIANGGFDRYGPDGQLIPGVAERAPAIGRIRVAAPTAIRPASRLDTTRTKTEILAADAALARVVATNGSTAFLDAVDPDAAMVMPWQPILRGTSESMTPFRSRYDAPAEYRWTPMHAVAGVGGRFGCTVGVSTFVAGGDSGSTRRSGRYITCWRKRADGQWRVVAHERSDSQQNPKGAAYDTVMAPAPHSATIATGVVRGEEVQRVETRYGVLGASGATGPAPAFVAYAADDAVLMPSFDVAHGREQIERTFDGWPPNAVLDWGPDARFGGGDGGLAFTVGPSTTTERTGQRRVMRRGHFLTVWRREPDGRWLYIFDLGSPRP
jgi:ketosteroid isomerase-like protein/sugar lactone lactonase YvrE